jgi:hypothetical protein
MENFSSFKRVVGGVPETHKQEIMERRSKFFLEQDFPELEGKEREKTPEELIIIELVDKATNEVLEKYGVEGFSVPENNIHIVNEKDWPDPQGSAFYNPMLQAVAIREASARIVFLKIMFHEMIHFKSYNALQVTTGNEPKVNQYRVGLTVVARDGDRQYFKFLNEAVTEELTKRFAVQLSSNALFSEERKRTLELMRRYPDLESNDGRKLFDGEVLYAETTDSDTWRDAVGRMFGRERSRHVMTEGFTYGVERKFLNSLIDKLYQANTTNFKDTKEVFDLFARAALTGNLLTIGKLIDKTFGLGTFRKIGEMGNVTKLYKRKCLI